MSFNKEVRNRAYVFNTASPAADANLLSTAISTTAHKFLRIYACFSAGGDLTARVTVSGATVSETLYTCSAGVAALVDIPIHPDETINFRYSAGAGTTYRFIVDEFSG